MDAAVTTLKFESKAVIPTDPRTKRTCFPDLSWDIIW